jgi:hypothetical protein
MRLLDRPEVRLGSQEAIPSPFEAISPSLSKNLAKLIEQN